MLTVAAPDLAGIMLRVARWRPIQFVSNSTAALSACAAETHMRASRGLRIAMTLSESADEV